MKRGVLAFIVITLILTSSCTYNNEYEVNQSQIRNNEGLFGKDGVREILLNQKVSLDSIERKLFYLTELRSKYSKEEIISMLSYIEGVSDKFPAMVSIFLIRDYELLKKLSDNHLLLQLETKRFASFLRKIKLSYMEDYTFSKKQVKQLMEYYDVYHSIESQYKELTKENNYKSIEERKKAKSILDVIEKNIERLKELNRSNG